MIKKWNSLNLYGAKRNHVSFLSLYRISYYCFYKYMLMDSKLIFFVDDDRVINNLMEYTFKSRKNYDVLTFKSGEECLDNLDQNPDLIVLDFHFNKTASARLNGLDTLKKIVSHDKGIPVIMLTSQDDEDIVDKLIENGAKRYIAKNAYFVDELMVAIDEELKN